MRTAKKAVAGRKAVYLIVLSSDHGNIEDVSVRAHTLNHALTILWRPRAREAAVRMQSIMEVSGEMLKALGIESP